MSALFSTAYLPPVQYVAAMLQHADTQIETKETFPKQTYRNRALIMTAGGVRPLIVPVVRTQAMISGMFSLPECCFSSIA